MMKKILVFLLTLVPLAAFAATTDCFNGPTWYKYRNTSLDIEGKGTFDNPVIIHTAEDLAQLSWLVNEQNNSFKNKVVVLDADIDLAKEENGQRVSWVPIGFDINKRFEGIFLGCGTENPQRHTIKGLYFDLINFEYNNYAGLFGSAIAFIGYLDIKEADLRIKPNNKSIKAGILLGRSHLYYVYEGYRLDCQETDGGPTFPVTPGIYGVSVEGKITMDGNGRTSTLGGMIGESVLSISHCTAKVTIRTSGELFQIGGLVGNQTKVSGQNDNTIIDCMTEVDIKATNKGASEIGGIVGTLENAEVIGCSSTGTIENALEGTSDVEGYGMGGIVGCIESGTKVLGCSSSITMKSICWMGGIAGTTVTYNTHTNPFIEGCAYSGHIDASQAAGGGGILGFCGYHVGQLINSCIFTGTIDRPAGSETCGGILGESKNAEEDAACCYYDIQMFNGQAAGDITEHHTIKGVKTDDFTSGNVSATPLLNIDTGDYGFTLKEGYYPAVYCKNKWPGYTKMLNNKFQSKTARQLLGSEMTTVNSVGIPVQWMNTLPALLKSYDFSTDWVSTLTFHTMTNLWEDNDNQISYNMIASMQQPDADFITTDGNELSAVKEGKGIITFQVRTKNKSTNIARPEALSVTRQMQLVSVVGKVWDGTIGTACAVGNGTAEDPYIIKNGSQLAYAVLNNKEYEFYEQVCDIILFKNRHADPENPDETHNLWMSNSWPNKDYLWKANYDGTGHFIKGAYIKKSGCGLFGDIEATGTVANLGIVDSHASSYAGLFAGYMDGAITNCIAHGSAGNAIQDWPELLPKSHSGGFCSEVGYYNAEAYIEDCISAVTSGNYTFEDYTPFVSISTGSKGTVRHCLAVVPFSHLDKDYKNNGITASGKSYIKNCYWLKGYEEVNTGQTLGEIEQQLGSRRLWQVTKGYFPALKTFAASNMGKLLSVPFHTDIDYAYDSENQESDNYLLGIGHQITFEPGTAVWTAVNDPSSTYLETDTDMGVVVPMHASYDEINNSFYKKARRLPGLVFVTGTLGDDKFQVPVRTRKGNVNAGFTFEDENARQACLAAFDTDHNNVLSLKELKAVTNEQTLTAFQTATARQIKTFPEFRFFKSVTQLTSQLNGLTKLESVQLPFALQTIGAEAFKGCSSLKQVTVSPKLANVMPRAFYGSYVDSIFVDPFNTTFTSRDGVLFTKDNGLVIYPNGRVGTEATIFGTVSSIASGAFYKVPQLKQLFFDTTDYTTVPQLAADALLTEDGSMMDVYVSDATYDRLLLTEYEDDASWQPYVAAGKLHQYFPLKIGSDIVYYEPNRFEQYVGTFYIGFPTQLPPELTPYVVNSIDEYNYKAYFYDKQRLVPALQPVIVMAPEPGTYRLVPAAGDLERWPVYGNWLIGVNRDGMRVNQSTSAQGSIMTLQMDKEHNSPAFLYEKKKEIEPYHCYLPFPTIDRPDWLVRNAHYDLVKAKTGNSNAVEENDFRYSVITLLPDNEKYATMLSYIGNERHVKVPGKLSDGTPVTQMGEAVFKDKGGSIISIDMTEMDNLEAFDSNRTDWTCPLGGVTREAYVYLGGVKATPNPNTILNDHCSVLSLYDGNDFYAPYDFHSDKVYYDRVLRATDKGGGKWESRAYTVCLPYELDLTEKSDAGQVGVYKLYFANKNKKVFTFSNADPHLEPGHAYVIVVNSDEITLNTQDVPVACEPFETWEVYDGEGGDESTGIWRGTFSKIESADAAAMYAYSLQSDGYFKRIRPDTPQAWWGAFRAMFCAAAPEGSDPAVSPLGTNWFWPVFQKWVAGGNDDDNPVLDFPSNSFEGDTDIPDDPSGIMHIIREDGTHQYFDLQGRKIQSPPAKGVYIHNGKTLIIK